VALVINNMDTVKANNNLYEIFPDLGRCFELIDRGICEKEREHQPIAGINGIKTQMNQVLELIEKMNNETISYTKPTTDNIFYILKKIEDWCKSHKLLHSRKADIFLIALKAECDKFRNMLKNIDK